MKPFFLLKSKGSNASSGTMFGLLAFLIVTAIGPFMLRRMDRPSMGRKPMRVFSWALPKSTIG